MTPTKASSSLLELTMPEANRKKERKKERKKKPLI
jgi:hypothetical protein